MGKIEYCAVGIMGRLEKFVVIMLGSVLERFFPTGAFPLGRWLELALIIVGLTSVITAIQRLIFTYKVLGNRKSV